MVFKKKKTQTRAFETPAGVTRLISILYFTRVIIIIQLLPFEDLSESFFLQMRTKSYKYQQTRIDKIV